MWCQKSERDIRLAQGGGTLRLTLGVSYGIFDLNKLGPSPPFKNQNCQNNQYLCF